MIGSASPPEFRVGQGGPKDFRRQFTDHHGRWLPLSADGITPFDLSAVPVTRYLWRGYSIPTPWTQPSTA
jgi:RNA-directed DNA polymerase